MESFWKRWNDVAHERELLLTAATIDWEAVKETLQMSNLLLINSPDRDIQRIVRLAQIPQYFDLDEKDRLIYVILGPHPPYVGQTGCITGPRSLMQRYREHLRSVRVLKNHFMGIKYRRVKALFGFGKTPSLASLLARQGVSYSTILPVQRVPPKIHGGAPERKWVQMLGITLNKRLPFGGLDRLRWDTILCSRATPREYRGCTTLVQEVVYNKGRSLDPEDGLTLASQALRRVEKNLF